MNNYIRPEMEISLFDRDDVIKTSGPGPMGIKEDMDNKTGGNYETETAVRFFY